MINRNIFTGLVNNENDVTELLVNLMHIYEDFRKASLKNLLAGLIDENIIDDVVGGIVAGNISTQYITNEGIPDIVIRSDNCHLLIENKIHVTTNLTSDQGNGYKSIFDDNARYKGLLFLIPRGYNYVDQINGVMEKFKNTKIKIDVVYWDDFLYCVENVEKCPVYKAAFERMQKVIDNTIVVDTRLLPHEKAMITSTEIFPLLNAIDKWLSDIGPEKWKLSISQNGIGYYTDNYHEFIGMSPKVKNVDFFFAQSSFSKKNARDKYCEWSDSENGYWIYTCPDEEVDCPIPSDPLDKYIYQQKILAVYTFTDKIIELCRQFVVSNKKLKLGHSQANHDGVGYYFDLENYSDDARYFIGYGPHESVENKLYVSVKSLAGKQAETPFFKIDDWLCYPIEKSCIFCDDLKTQQEKFNNEALKAFNKVKENK